jgi:hypothetical protein
MRAGGSWSAQLAQEIADEKWQTWFDATFDIASFLS